MQNARKISQDLYWVGGSDRRIALFENAYPVPRGVSYNSYLLLDEKTVLFDTTDHAVSRQLFENVAAVLNGRALDYLVIHHMEPDHCSAIEDLLLRYPTLQLVCTAKAAAMIGQFFELGDLSARTVVVNEGDTLSTGRHALTFVTAPMVHWPEVMLTYDTTDKVLFSADAFGSFGAMNGNLFADEVDYAAEWLEDSRRYYTNIVGKYGVQVQAALKKAAGLEIKMICPLHGLLWRENIGWLLEKYNAWSTYTPEEKGVVIAYGSIYGNTENAANILAGMLAERGVRNIHMYDVSATHPSYILSDAFRFSHVVFASITYNSGIFTNMENLLHDIAAHNLQNRTIAFMQNGSWAATSAKQMAAVLEKLKNMTVLEPLPTLKSSVKPAQVEEIAALADAIVASM